MSDIKFTDNADFQKLLNDPVSREQLKDLLDTFLRAHGIPADFYQGPVVGVSSRGTQTCAEQVVAQLAHDVSQPPPVTRQSFQGSKMNLQSVPRLKLPVKEVGDTKVIQVGDDPPVTFTISPGDGNGTLGVTCRHYPYLNGEHSWDSTGTDNFYQFLTRPDQAYLSEKLFGRQELMELNPDATRTAMKNELTDALSNDDLTEENAKELEMEVDAAVTAQDFHLIYDEHGNNYHHCLRYQERPGTTWFWGEVWPAFIQYLKDNGYAC